MNPDTLTTELEAAHNRLTQAQRAYTDAAIHQTAVKATLDYNRAELINNGVEGKNAEQREASIMLRLDSEHERLLEADTYLACARRDLEIAKLDWELARCKLRLLEVMKEGAA